MMVEQLSPEVAEVEVSDITRRLRELPVDEPFAPSRMSMCVTLSKALLGDPEARDYPDLQAAGFAMRPAAVAQLRDEFTRLNPPEQIALPRGIVFHIPPSNVGTVLLYSWLYSFLAGNTNVIRAGSADSPQLGIMLRLLQQTGAGAVVLRYGHDAAITEALSAVCDVRVIWGGDETVKLIRAIALPPRTRELTFSDRSSLAAIRTRAWLGAPESRRDSLTQGLFNDIYWFDQLACSSPRVLIWCGGEPAEVDEAASDLHERVARRVAEKGYTTSTGTFLEKTTFACGTVIDRDVRQYRTFGNELTVMRVQDLCAVPERHPGGGLLFECAVPELAAIAPQIRNVHQTLAVFGFDETELRRFALSMKGRGIDRIVPIGSALAFHHVWDGCHLLEEFTRRLFLAPQAD